MIAAARTIGTWVVVAGFLIELMLAIPFSIYVLVDAVRDYRLVRETDATGEDACLITDMFVKTEIARLVKMTSFLAIILLSFTQPVAEHVQDDWFVFLTRCLFLVIGAALAFNSAKEFRTRRELFLIRREGRI